jgi:hypothetical protein
LRLAWPLSLGGLEPSLNDFRDALVSKPFLARDQASRRRALSR